MPSSDEPTRGSHGSGNQAAGNRGGGVPTTPQGLHLRVPVLWSDGRVAVVDKPEGLLVHPNYYDRASPNCVNALAGIFHRKVRVVHRLDRATSGLMLFALDAQAATDISEMFRDGRIVKQYLALVRGHTDDEGYIDRPLVREEGKDPSPARTRFRTLQRTEIPHSTGVYESAWFSLVLVDLLTGRRHQARRHLQDIESPIIGDSHHGDRANNQLVEHLTGATRLYLRAIRLSLDLPYSGETLEAVSGVPTSWRAALSALGMKAPEEFLSARVRVGERDVFNSEPAGHSCP